MRYIKRIYNYDHELYDDASDDEYTDEDELYDDEPSEEQSDNKTTRATRITKDTPAPGSRRPSFQGTKQKFGETFKSHFSKTKTQDEKNTEGNDEWVYVEGKSDAE
ncbi:uncharacterized protein BXIN_1245 [Babesia sp. Xinjiang]|uniref:uncharacterized protein n=1 Tax=Babesia sp. Xinjiang TaxID=462227 RepID=UPI000A214F14|nr:uncharacterized protein BXIN_1245 [Babesia sp. Xinjiang]ORM40004.1 hypothetical protein BXIN_1245 [Babesia sp. Xinjiang]